MGLKAVKGNKKVEYEFGGPVGAFFTVVSLPPVIYGLYFLCNPAGCLSVWPLQIPALPDLAAVEWWNNTAFLATLAWIAWLIVLSFIVPAPSALGVKLENGDRLTYKLNGRLPAPAAGSKRLTLPSHQDSAPL